MLDFKKMEPTFQLEVQIFDQSNFIEKINWIIKNVVTKANKKSDCSSCWSFLTTNKIEGAQFVAN